MTDHGNESAAERLEQLDKMTLTDYSHEATVEVRFLTNPTVPPEDLEEALEHNFADEIKGSPVSVEAEVTQRE